MGALLTLSVSPVALAQAPVPAALSADIPAQPLAEALEVFARQTGLHIVYVSRVVRNQSSHAVSAGASASEALALLLQGTGLSFEFLTRHSVRILAAMPGAVVESPPAPDESHQSLPDVLVTGSRIPVPANITAAGPLQVLTARDVLLTGYADTVDVMNELPQITGSGADFGNHSNPSAAAGGFATVDLRGLQPQRTVVLINGRRLGLGDPNTANPSPAPDLDQIPVAMIERVEVLTGGASSTYGSDAIAGVVNFILKDHVQGVQIDAQYGFAEHTQQNEYIQGAEAAAGTTPPRGTGIDGFRRDVSVLAGTGFHDGDGQVTGYFIYHGQNAVPGSARDFSDCPAVSTNALTGVVTQGGFTCLADTQSNLFLPNAGAGGAYSVVGSQFVPWPAAGSQPAANFNYAPYWSAQRQDTRYQAGLLAHVDINQTVKPYVELSFMEDQTRTYISPSGLFTGGNNLTADGGYLVNCSNPLLSAQEASLLCTPAEIAADRAQPGSASADLYIGRRNIEGGARLSSYEHRNYRAVAGVDGTLDDAWSYDAYALYYYTSLLQAEENYLDNVEIARALQVTTDPAGRPVCISGGSCVPYDIFTTGAVTAQQLAYLYRTGTDGGSNSEQIIEADVTGQLLRYGLIAPWAHDGVAFNAGAEHRTETLRFAPGAAELSGDLSGYGLLAVAIDQRVSVDEGFMEMRVPIAQDRPLARDVTIDAGYRYSTYSTAGATNTYKLDLQYAPVADVRLRASYDRVVRAPNLIELYTPLSYGQSQTVSSDPCAPTDGGATHAAASLAQCMHTGVSAAQYGNGIGPAFGGTSTIAQCVASACGVLSGGNPALAPETADTWSLGLTFTPTALTTLTGSVDYFHIRLTGEIGSVPESVTLQQCLATGDPTLCSQIVRTPAGALSGATVAGGGYILANAVNTGKALVSGIDVQVNDRLSVGRWGALMAGLTGSWLQHNASTPYLTAPSYDCAGLFGASCLNGSVNPTWRHNLRVTWETPWDLELSAQWRFIGGTGFDNNSAQPVLSNAEEGFYNPLLTHIPNYSYFDLSAIWAVTRNVQVRFGVNNLLDKDPPFVPLEVSHASGALNALPAYDILGREIFMAIHATF
ncbi:MAG TPA: TonB-dependent receptor [Steroidobacteraceae bacterium]|nr:TonB-dependent receptor [Steroidobacteraceae bacterium]